MLSSPLNCGKKHYKRANKDFCLTAESHKSQPIVKWELNAAPHWRGDFRKVLKRTPSYVILWARMYQEGEEHLQCTCDRFDSDRVHHILSSNTKGWVACPSSRNTGFDSLRGRQDSLEAQISRATDR